MASIFEVTPNIPTASLEGKIFMFYGTPKTGKTTVASQFPGSLILAFEKGYQYIPGAMAFDIKVWSDFTAAVRDLKKPQAKEKFKTIIIDTVPLAYTMAYEYTLRRLGIETPRDLPHGQAWTEIKSEFTKQIDSILRLGYGLVLISHAEEKEVNKEIKIKADIQNQVRGYLEGLADFILYIHKEDDVSNPDWNVYAYSDLPSIEAGSRAKYLPKKILFTFEELKKALGTAVDVQNKELNLVEAEQAAISPKNHFKIELAPLKDEVTALAQALMQSSAAQETIAFIERTMRGVRISQTTEEHIDQLLAIRDYLSNLQSQLANGVKRNAE